MSTQDSLLCVTFNQDFSSLGVGCHQGYRLFTLAGIDDFTETYCDRKPVDVKIVERLFSSSLVATVNLSSPRRLNVSHFKKGSEICNYCYPNSVLAVRLNRQRLVVCLADSIYIHNIRDMKVLHTIRDTPNNPRAVCALSECGQLAYPGSAINGEVQIFDTVNLQAVIQLTAHDNPLAALSFNRSGDRLATASEKGTVIRVFALPAGSRLFEFRRGVARCVTISSLSFSQDSSLLCVCSNTVTIHIFRLIPPSSTPPSGSSPTYETSSWMGYFGKALADSAAYLPSQMADIITQGRDFAQARLPVINNGDRINGAIITLNNAPRVVVASSSGMLYIFNIDQSEGGECVLIKQHRIDVFEPSVPSASSSKTSSNGDSEDQPPMTMTTE